MDYSNIELSRSKNDTANRPGSIFNKSIHYCIPVLSLEILQIVLKAPSHEFTVA